MEILKNMSEKEITQLRDRFLKSKNGALCVTEFEEVLSEACRGKDMVDVRQLHLQQLFNNIDINGDGTVSWDEFTMFLITGARSEAHPVGIEERAVKNYNLIHTIADTEVPGSIVECRYCPKVNKMLKVTRRERVCKVKLCEPTMNLPTWREVPRIIDLTILTAEYIPACSDVRRSGCLAVSYGDSVLRLYDSKKRQGAAATVVEMPLRKETKLLESQTVLRWSNRYHRLVMGSRTGVVSVLDVDQSTVYSKERIHSLLIPSMVLQDHFLFTASVDPDHSVKCVDLHKSVVRFALNGHAQGATLVDVSECTQQLYSAGFELYVLAYSLALPRQKPYKLQDMQRPHKGIIVSLQSIEGAPQLVTADTKGLVKVWDVRMYNCVQTLNLTKDAEWLGEKDQINAITSMGYVPDTRCLVVNGRDTRILQYDEASSPQLSDDVSCSFVIYNDVSQTFLTVHNSSIKLWNASNGCLRALHNNIVSSDITSIVLSTPLCRKFFVGTLEGSLFSFGYAVCALLRHFPQTYTKEKEEITAMVFIEQLRDVPTPYIIVGFKHEVTLVPDAEEHVQRSVLQLLCVEQALATAPLKSLALIKGGYLAICTVNKTILFVDLNTFTLIYTWCEGSMIGDVSGLTISTLGSGSILFCTDGSGKIFSIAMSSLNSLHVVNMWKASVHTATAMHDPPARRSRIADTLEHVLPDNVVQLTQMMPQDGANYLMQKSDTASACVVTALTYLDEMHTLISADEKGNISVWDVSSIIQSAMQRIQGSRSISSPEVRLITMWRAHDDEITCLTAFQTESSSGLKKFACVSSGEDKQVFFWSLDGVCLGSLSQGRQDLDAHGKVVAFTLESPLDDSWQRYSAYQQCERLVSPYSLDQGPLGRSHRPSAVNLSDEGRSAQQENPEVDQDASVPLMVPKKPTVPIFGREQISRNCGAKLAVHSPKIIGTLSKHSTPTSLPPLHSAQQIPKSIPSPRTPREFHNQELIPSAAHNMYEMRSRAPQSPAKLVGRQQHKSNSSKSAER